MRHIATNTITISHPGLLRVAFLLCLFSLSLPVASANGSGADQDDQWIPSEMGLYRVSYTSRLDPIAINTMHQWVLHLQTAAGEAAEGAKIEITGGMPSHGHGLPTAPRVSRYLGNGDYLVDGLRFHMMGQWRIQLTIEHRGNADSLAIPLTL